MVTFISLLVLIITSPFALVGIVLRSILAGALGFVVGAVVSFAFGVLFQNGSTEWVAQTAFDMAGFYLGFAMWVITSQWLIATISISKASVETTSHTSYRPRRVRKSKRTYNSYFD